MVRYSQVIVSIMQTCLLPIFCLLFQNISDNQVCMIETMGWVDRTIQILPSLIDATTRNINHVNVSIPIKLEHPFSQKHIGVVRSQYALSFILAINTRKSHATKFGMLGYLIECKSNMCHSCNSLYPLGVQPSTGQRLHSSQLLIIPLRRNISLSLSCLNALVALPTNSSISS